MTAIMLGSSLFGVFGAGRGFGASLATAPPIPWAAPTDVAAKDTGQASSALTRPYQCTSVTYRFAGDLTKTMQVGCFVPAAFGLFDPERSVVIFNGTDEAEYVRYNGNSAPLFPLPYSETMALFSGHPQGVGTYMNLYISLPTELSDSISGLTVYKILDKPPDMTVSGPDGQPLVVNSSAMGWAPRGQWMVTESPSHALVRVNLATFGVLPFAPSLYSSGTPYATHAASLAITADGRYAAAGSSEYHSLKVYDLQGCTTSTNDPDPLAPQNCATHDYWSYLAGLAGTAAFSVAHVAFVRDDLLSFDVITANSTHTYVLSPNGDVSSLIPYLGLGDSYASGQGAFDYLAGTDTNSNHCHLAARSYPLLLSGDIFAGQGHSVACSGARIRDLGNLSGNYAGQNDDRRTTDDHEADGSATDILHNFMPGALAQQQFVTHYQPGVMTVQVGGNDIGFADILLRCLSPIAGLQPPKLNPNSCYQSYEDRLELTQTIDRTYGAWVQLYEQLRQTAPDSRIYVIGYPQILSANAECGLNVHLTAAEIGFARELIDYLNGVIQQAAAAAGVQYVSIRDALAGYELCNGSHGQTAVNGLTAGSDTLGVLSQESFHPTAFGHQLIERAILATTHNFAPVPKLADTPNAPVPIASTGSALLQAPHTGRPTTTIMPVSVTTGSLTVGGNLHLTVSGSEASLQPNSNYEVQINQATIATVHSDGQGNIASTITVPPTASPGIGQVTLMGLGQDGTPQTVTQTVYIDASNTDYDGDGLPNGQDSCPLVTNSGIDIDGDGIDDACDSSLVVSPPSNSGNTDSTGGTSGTTSPPILTTTSPQTPASTLLDTATRVEDLPGGAYRVPGMLAVKSRTTRPTVTLQPVAQKSSHPRQIQTWSYGTLPRYQLWWLALIIMAALVAALPGHRQPSVRWTAGRSG